jgi:hypothetical protein
VYVRWNFTLDANGSTLDALSGTATWLNSNKVLTQITPSHTLFSTIPTTTIPNRIVISFLASLQSTLQTAVLQIVIVGRSVTVVEGAALSVTVTTIPETATVVVVTPDTVIVATPPVGVTVTICVPPTVTVVCGMGG